MSERQEANAREVVDAIRLALEGAANDKTASAIIRTILADGPAPNRRDTNSVRRLLRAIKRTRYGRLHVVTRSARKLPSRAENSQAGPE